MATSQSYSTPIILPASSDAKDSAAQYELSMVFFAVRMLAMYLDNYTGAQSPLISEFPNQSVNTVLGNKHYKFYAIAGAAINYGAMVSLNNYTPTTVQASPAQANNANFLASAFCVTQGGVAAGSWGEFIVGPGINTGLAGLTPGSWYWLSPTSTTGQITLTRPSTAGQVAQMCGRALTDTTLQVGSLNNWVQL